MITSESGSIYPTTDVLHQAGPSARLLHQAGPPSAPPPGRAFSTAPPPGRSLQHGSSTRKTRLQCKGSRRHCFRVKVQTTEKEEEGEGVESSEVVR
ncbi:unnamed protein product [Boreogadus saida]